MSNEGERGKSLKERFEDFVQDVLDTLGSLVTPEPELVPVPIPPRARPRPYRR